MKVDSSVQVPREYVQGGEIVLNVSMDATSSLKLGNDFIEFKARFGGKPREIMVPIHRVMAIYARENGQGMAFPVSDEADVPAGLSAVDNHSVANHPEHSGTKEMTQSATPGRLKRPDLKRVK